MSQVPSEPKPDSGSSISGKSASAKRSTEEYADIKLANKKVRLIDVMRQYGFKVEKNPYRPSWAENIKCPLSSHKAANERTASFGYCFVSDHFFCLGCGKGGRAVEFMSLYEDIPRGAVAERILAKYGDKDADEEFKEYEDDISPILLDSGKYLQVLVQKNKSNPEALKKIDKLIWWIDFYLQAKSGKNITPAELEYRTNRMKEILNEMLNTG